MDMVLDLMEGGGRSSFPSASDRGLLRGLGELEDKLNWSTTSFGGFFGFGGGVSTATHVQCGRSHDSTCT